MFSFYLLVITAVFPPLPFRVSCHHFSNAALSFPVGKFVSMPSSVSTYVRALKPVFSVGWVFSICRRVTLERSPELLAAAKPPRRKPNRHSTLIKKVKCIFCTEGRRSTKLRCSSRPTSRTRSTLTRRMTATTRPSWSHRCSKRKRSVPQADLISKMHPREREMENTTN